MQNRKPPAYQEYAAELLSNRKFRLMTLAQRGLLQTMRLECWANSQVPTQSAELARYLGIAVEEVNSTLTDGVKSFFTECDGSFSCPELEDYRQHLVERKLKQSAGGKQGASITNSNRSRFKKPASDSDTATPSSNPHATRQGEVKSLVKQSQEKQSQNQFRNKGNAPVDDNWVKDYEQNEYAKASRGN